MTKIGTRRIVIELRLRGESNDTIDEAVEFLAKTLHRSLPTESVLGEYGIIGRVVSCERDGIKFYIQS